jgi:hypothetical protein
VPRSLADFHMTQGLAIPAFNVIKPWLCRNLVDLNSTVLATYDDKRLMAGSGSLIVVGTARRITQETIGFLIEIDDSSMLAAKQFCPSTVATWHIAAIKCSRSLISVMEAREKAAKPLRHDRSAAIVKTLISAEFAKKNGRFEELDKDIQEAIILEASVLAQIPKIVETFYDSASEIYKSSLRASDQTRRLIEVWQQRGTLIRHRVGVQG